MWKYRNKKFTSDDIGDHVAFVYRITNLTNGRMYIGKKKFFFTRTKPPLKGKTRKRKIKKESDWKTYWGSNQELIDDVKALGEDKFKRTILRLCNNLTEANYYEAKEQFAKDALLSEKFYNEWIMVKVRKAGL